MTVKILAIDTSTENCSVALVIGDTYYTRRAISPRDHAKKILPMVDEVLKEADLTLTELDALAFGRGPGSFTGVRICVGIAQGLAFGAELPLIQVSTLKAMAQGSFRISGVEHVAPAIDARMEEIYWARYQRTGNGDWNAVDPEQVIAPATLLAQAQPDVHTWQSAGTGWGTYRDVLTRLPLTIELGSVLYPDAEDIAYLAKIDFAKGLSVEPEAATPVYLRDKVVWKKLPGRE